MGVQPSRFLVVSVFGFHARVPLLKPLTHDGPHITVGERQDIAALNIEREEFELGEADQPRVFAKFAWECASENPARASNCLSHSTRCSFVGTGSGSRT